MTEPEPEPEPEPIRVLLADDQELLRGSLRLLVDSTPGLVAVGEAGTGARAVALARTERPDVVLMDVRMPGMDGIEATRRICAEPSGVRVLILTTFDLDEYVYAGLRAGASGFLLKNTPPADLLAAIRVIAAGEGLLAPSVTRRLIAQFAQSTPAQSTPAQSTPAQSTPFAQSAQFARTAADRPRSGPSLDGLTVREREVLTLVARGLSNLEIAANLHVSTATVKTHIGHLLAKLGARDRAQLVIAAYEGGLVSTSRTRP